MLGKDQHSVGYAVQTAFIGAGAVVGSLFPSLMEAMGVANVAPPGQIPDTVRYAFWFGGLALFLAVLWTIVATREYKSEEHTSELQSLMRISYAVFCLKKKIQNNRHNITPLKLIYKHPG